MKTTNNKTVLVIITLVALLLSFGCADVSVNPSADGNFPGVIIDHKYKAYESFFYSVDLSGQTALKVENINGEVKVQSVTGINQVTISGEKIVSSDSYQDAHSNLKNITIDVNELTGEILVKTAQPNYSNGRTYSVNYIINFPSDLSLDVNNVNGSIALDIPQSTSAKFFASLVNGSISLQNLILHNSVETTKSIQGTLGDGQGMITLRLINGNINVSGF